MRGNSGLFTDVNLFCLFQDSLTMCWAFDPEKRPTFSNLLRILERLPKHRQRLHRSPSQPCTVGRGAETLILNWMNEPPRKLILSGERVNFLFQKTVRVWGAAAVGQALLGSGSRLVSVPSRKAEATPYMHESRFYNEEHSATISWLVPWHPMVPNYQMLLLQYYSQMLWCFNLLKL